MSKIKEHLEGAIAEIASLKQMADVSIYWRLFTVVSRTGGVMKLLARSLAVLSLVGSTILGPSLMGDMRALALPPEQILQKLRPVPVFTITNQEGAPLVASISDGNDNSSVAGVFISRSDAENFVNQLTQRNPELANSVKVVPVSLAEVYEMQQSNQGTADRPLSFDYVPVAAQVDLARSVLDQNGQEGAKFNGVPLFLATGGQENGYLTIEQGSEQVIPLFFNKADLEGLLGRLQSQQPDLAGSVSIQVVNLQGVLKLLQNSNDNQLDKIVLIPPRESLEYIRELQGSQPGQ